MDSTDEQWKDIPGYEGFYQVSDHGHVKALARVVTKSISNPGRGSSPTQFWAERIMHTSPKSRYAKVSLRRDGQKISCNVNVLALLAFVGEPPPGQQCCHNDGNPHNNFLSNLRWDTCRNNQLDRKRHGTALDGEKHPNAKLTDAQVLAIRVDQRSHSAVARDYDTTKENRGKLETFANAYLCCPYFPGRA